ncbi:uncharacterized protein [Palaemon carinicauda]|uniref:uncharacterized protein n=1 Tax=Palaemon carinicauda TaxID=392227 RepID=UPI0035B5B243
MGPSMYKKTVSTYKSPIQRPVIHSPGTLEKLLKTLDNPPSYKHPKSVTPPSTSPAPDHGPSMPPATPGVLTTVSIPVSVPTSSPAPARPPAVKNMEKIIKPLADIPVRISFALPSSSQPSATSKPQTETSVMDPSPNTDTPSLNLAEGHLPDSASC